MYLITERCCAAEESHKQLIPSWEHCAKHLYLGQDCTFHQCAASGRVLTQGVQYKQKNISKPKEVKTSGWKVPGGCSASRKEERIMSPNLGQHWVKLFSCTTHSEKKEGNEFPKDNFSSIIVKISHFEWQTTEFTAISIHLPYWQHAQTEGCMSTVCPSCY